MGCSVRKLYSYRLQPNLLNNSTIIVPTYKLLKKQEQSPTPDSRVAEIDQCSVKTTFYYGRKLNRDAAFPLTENDGKLRNYSMN